MSGQFKSTSRGGGSGSEDEDCGFELSNELARFFIFDGVRNEDAMLDEF